MAILSSFHPSIRYFLAILFVYLCCLVFYFSNGSEDLLLSTGEAAEVATEGSKEGVLESLWPQVNVTHQ